MNFLNNLTYLLKSKHMSRSELGRTLNISPSTINSWYTRSSDGLALKYLIDIAKFFDVSLDILVESEDIETDLKHYREQKKDIQVQPFTEKEIQQIKRLIKYAELLSNTEGSEND